MKNILKYLGVTLAFVLLIIVTLGIYRFNFTNDDIYTQTENGKIVNIASKIKIATPIVPLASIINYIGGDEVLVNNIIPVGVSPHSFSVKPKQIIDIQNSDLIIDLNLDEIDGFLSKITSKKEKLTLSKEITFIEGFVDEDDDKDEHNEDEHGKDPHIWLGISNAKLMAEKIKNKLVELRPLKKDIFEQNYKSFSEEIDSLVADFKKDIKEKTLKEFIVFHNAYNYLFNDLGIKQDKKIVFKSNVLKNPNSSEIKAILDQINKYGVKSAFIEPQFTESILDKFSKKYNLNLYKLDPIGTDFSKKGYLQNLKNNLLNLRNIYE